MPTYTIESKQFEDLLKNNEIILIDFWAEWCAPCKQFATVYERVADQNPTLKFAKVNIEEEAELADGLQIRSIPHLMIFKQGIQPVQCQNQCSKIWYNKRSVLMLVRFARR